MPKDTSTDDTFHFLDGIGGPPEAVSLPLGYQGRILYNLCRSLIFTPRDDENDNSPDPTFTEHALAPLVTDVDRSFDGYYCAANDRVAVKIRQDRTMYIILKDKNSGDEKSFFTLDSNGDVGVLETSLSFSDVDPRACQELLRVATSLVADLFEEQKRAVMERLLFGVREQLAPFFGWEVPAKTGEKS